MDFLITKKVRLVDVKPDLAKSVATRFGKKVEELEFVLKGIEPGDLKFDDKEHSSVDYITTKTVDRDGEIVEPTGVVLEHYRKHPVVLFSHEYKELPIGRCAWIKCDSKGLIAKTIYAKHDEANKIYEYRRDGFPLAKSIGFVPLEAEELDPEKNNGACRRYKQCLLLEYSDVTVPSNPDALQIAISKGLLSLLPGQTVYMDEQSVEIVSEDMKIKSEEVVEKAIKKEVVEKTVDTQGNVSVWDILSAIQKAVNQNHINEMGAMMNQDNMSSGDGYWNYCSVQDLFPYDYPNGTVIIICSYKGCSELFMYDYSFDNNVVTLVNPKSVSQTYVVNAEMTKSIKEELVKSWFPNIVLKPEVGTDYIHLPVMNEEGKHSGEGHKVRTITLSKKSGIMAKYCVTDKKVFSVMFPKSGFTMAEAKKWMKDHDMMKELWEELIETKLLLEIEEKGVISYHDYGNADEGEAWNAGAEVKAASIDDLKKMCAWVSDESKDLNSDIEKELKKGDFKLPHHRQSDKKCVWRGVAAAMGALMGARGGVAVPTDDKKSVYNHLAKHYKAFDKEAPAFKEFTQEEIDTFEEQVNEVACHYEVGDQLILVNTEMKNILMSKELSSVTVEIIEEKAGRALSAKNRKLIEECINSMGGTKDMLQGVLDSNDNKSIEKGGIEIEYEEKTGQETKGQGKTEEGTSSIPKESEESVVEFEDDVVEFDENELKEVLSNAVKASQVSFEQIAENAIKRLRGKVF